MTKILKKSIILATASLAMVGCFGPGEFLEPVTYGVPNSQWHKMSAEEKREKQQDYYQEQKLKMLESKIELLEKQNKALQRYNDEERRDW